LDLLYRSDELARLTRFGAVDTARLSVATLRVTSWRLAPTSVLALIPRKRAAKVNLRRLR